MSARVTEGRREIRRHGEREGVERGGAIGWPGGKGGGCQRASKLDRGYAKARGMKGARAQASRKGEGGKTGGKGASKIGKGQRGS